MNQSKAFVSAALFAVLSAAPSPAEAQIAEVRQTIFGMDCAPCAYAVERRLGNLEGLDDVELSLNEGFASLSFSGAHETTLERIRQAIRDSGFSPREARIRLRGRVTSEEGAPVLRTPAGERYLLVDPEAKRPLEEGVQLALGGTVAADQDPEGRWVLRIETFDPATE